MPAFFIFSRVNIEKKGRKRRRKREREGEEREEKNKRGSTAPRDRKELSVEFKF